jgi:hypothetical protein
MDPVGNRFACKGRTEVLLYLVMVKWPMISFFYHFKVTHNFTGKNPQPPGFGRQDGNPLERAKDLPGPLRFRLA